MKFYLGTHMPNFVAQVNIPWFVSVTRVIDRKTRIIGDWMLDSGGFTQIHKYGKYNISESKYLDVIEIQNPGVAFCQDWMCEPSALMKTGLTIKDHQERTIENYLSLSEKSPLVRPVLQGWDASDYVTHLRQYQKAGVNMGQLFGVGTVCSRNGNPNAIREIFKKILSEEPKLKLHGFGIKTDSLVATQDLLWSADSMAWCITAWRMGKLCHEYCPTQTCSNCLEFALLWRKKNLYRMQKDKALVGKTDRIVYEKERQMEMF